MAKQVQKTVTEEVIGEQNPKNLYIKVETFNVEGREIGTRIVDMYHFGTRNWMANHVWWAMHNSNTIETTPATDVEVEAHIAAQKIALAAKFNTKAA